VTPLAEAIPALSRELHRLLTEAHEHELAAQIAGLRIVDRCSCGGDHCATFHTEPKPQGHYKNHRNVMLQPAKGIIILDVTSGHIACVEVLYRPEYVRALDAVLPR